MGKMGDTHGRLEILENVILHLMIFDWDNSWIYIGPEEMQHCELTPDD